MTAEAETVLQSLDAGIAIVEQGRGVTYINAKGREILGQQWPFIERDVFAEDATGNRLELSVSLSSGAQLTLGYHVSRVPNDPATDHARRVLLFQDITRWAALRKERDRLLQLATVGETLPTLLHELKNPLAAITSSVEVLLEETEPSRLRDDLHAILSEVRRMRLAFDGIGLIGDNEIRDKLTACDLAIREAAQLMAARARRSGVSYDVDVQDMPLLPFSAAALRAVTFNLVRNAIDACEHGGVLRVIARFTPSPASLELSVTDTGKGMDEEVLARCRELFFSTKANGSGIGLALCARVVEQGGGHMTIDSSTGKGTRVRVSLPVRPSLQRVERSPLCRE